MLFASAARSGSVRRVRRAEQSTTAAEFNPDEPWTPRSYIVEKRFCPTAAVGRWLEEWRTANGHAWGLLVPFTTQPGTVFGSLTVVAHGEPEAAQRLQNAVSTHMDEAASRHLEHAVRAVADNSEAQQHGALVPAHLVGDVLVLIGSMLETIDIARPLRGVDFHRLVPWPADTGLRFFILTNQHDRAASKVMAAPTLAPLEVLLHATHQVVMHLHERPGRRADRNHDAKFTLDGSPGFRDGLDLDALTPAAPSTHIGPEHVYDDLLARSPAIRSPDSDPIAVYFWSRDRAGLDRAAENNAPCAPLHIDVTDESSSAVFSALRRRPWVANRVRTDPLLHSTMRVRWFGNPDLARKAHFDFSEIVVPVPTAAGQPDDVAGILVIQRAVRNDGDVYDTHDLSDCEQLALQLALRRSNLLFAEATGWLAELTNRSQLSSATSVRDRGVPPAWRQVPSDYLHARSTLQRALALAYRYAPAQRAVLYLLDWRQQSLVPVATAGDGHDEFDAGIALGLRDGGGLGLPSVVIQTGCAQVVHDIAAPGNAQAVMRKLSRQRWRERGIRSGIALPITVFDRPVGVMELLSATPAAFQEPRRFLEAVAQQISLSLMLAQRAEEQRAFAFASATAVHAHEILKRVDRLRATGDTENIQIAGEIESLIDALRSREHDVSFGSADPFEILRDVVRDAGLSEFVEWRNLDRVPRIPPLPGPVQLALKMAAHEVLKNSKAHLDPHAKSRRVLVRPSLIHRGGLPRLLVEIAQEVPCRVQSRLESQIYRTPIDDRAPDTVGRRHFGAFTAGYWMRAVGGEVFLSENSESRPVFVGTTIEIPIFTLMPVSDAHWPELEGPIER